MPSRPHRYVLLNSPLHGSVAKQDRWQPVEDLMSGPSEGVEDGGVQGTR